MFIMSSFLAYQFFLSHFFHEWFICVFISIPMCCKHLSMSSRCSRLGFSFLSNRWSNVMKDESASFHMSFFKMKNLGETNYILGQSFKNSWEMNIHLSKISNLHCIIYLLWNILIYTIKFLMQFLIRNTLQGLYIFRVSYSAFHYAWVALESFSPGYISLCCFCLNPSKSHSSFLMSLHVDIIVKIWIMKLSYFCKTYILLSFL